MNIEIGTMEYDGKAYTTLGKTEPTALNVDIGEILQIAIDDIDDNLFWDNAEVVGLVRNSDEVDSSRKCLALMEEHAKLRKAHQSNPPFPNAYFDEQVHRWKVRDEDETTNKQSTENINSVFSYRGDMTPALKRRTRAELIKKYGENKTFRDLSTGLAFYTQGFFDHIRDISAALVSDTLDDYEANAVGYFRNDISEKNKNPLLSITIGKVIDIYGNNSDDDNESNKHLKVLRYNEAKEYALDMIEALKRKTPTEEPLFRGIMISRNNLPEFKSGESLNIAGLTSFTRDEKIANSFALGNAKGQPKSYRERTEKKHRSYGPAESSHIPILISVIGQNKALDADVFSPFSQKEAITNGEFEIISFDDKSWPNKLTLKQKHIADFSWGKGKGVNYRLPKDIANDLTEDEYYAVVQVKTYLEKDLEYAKKYKKADEKYVSTWFPQINKKMDKDKLIKVFEKLGYRVDPNGSIYYDIK